MSGSPPLANIVPSPFREQGWFEKANPDADYLESWLAMGALLEGVVLYYAFRVQLTYTLFYSFLINLITHPIAWWMVTVEKLKLFHVETGVIVVESLLILFLFKVALRRAFIWSTAANLVSMEAGLLLSRLL